MYKIFQNKDHEGFSLAELLVVVAILTILAAIAIPLFLNQKKKAADGVVRSDLHNVGIDLASLYTGTVTTITGSDGNISANLTVDGMTVDKKGARVYANNTGQWCVSKVSTSGNIFAITSTNRSVYEATTNCIAPSTQPTGGSGGGTIVSEEGNLLTTNQATFSSGTTTGWTHTGATVTQSVSNGTGYDDSYADTVTVTADGSKYIITNAIVLSTSGLVEGDRVTVTAMINTVGGSPTTMELYSYNAGGTNVGGMAAVSVPAGTAWTRITGTYTIPVGVSVDNIRIVVRPGLPVGSSFKIDNVGVWKGSGGQWAPPGQPIYQ